MMTINCRTAAGVLGLALTLPAAAAAQAPSLDVVPKVGVATPLGSLTEEAEMSTSLAFGAALELGLPGLPFGVRANVDHISGAEIRQRAADELKLGTANITQIVGDIVFRPLPGLVGSSPFLLAGAGIRIYDLDITDGGELALLRSSFRRFTGHVGGGVDVRIGRATVAAEVADYISTFALAEGGSKLQNDVVGLLGIRLRLF
jgi:hypothetical protein